MEVNDTTHDLPVYKYNMIIDVTCILPVSDVSSCLSVCLSVSQELVVNSVCVNSSQEYIVAGTDNNLVCIWKKMA